VFHYKVRAACHVINGFGKTTGLVQIDELGTLETPILFTNTLSVGTVETALVKYMLERNPDICETTGSVNPVVCECNDSGLNDIRGLHVTEAHVAAALADCKADFAEGAVGAGRGMRCHGLKGGIGSASRLVELDGKSYTIGAMVLSNHATFDDLIVAGTPIHELLEARIPPHEDKGSIIAEGTPNELKNRYSYDSLLSYMKRSEAFETGLMRGEYAFVYDPVKKAYRIKVEDSDAAKRLMQEFDEYTKDVEIIKGTMDDVFLNVTGRNIVQTGEERDAK